MFSTHEYLSRKTPNPGINREEFIGHLIEEYYTTTDIEAQEQVTANLANFAYDPINWAYLKKHNALQLFIEILDIPNENLNLHGTAGICNICLDKELQFLILDKSNLDCLKKQLFKTKNVNIILNILSIFYQLLHVDISESKADILTVDVLKKLHKFSNGSLKDARMHRIAANVRHFSKASRSHFPATELHVIKRFSQRDLDEFSALTGDLNPIHTAAIGEKNRKVHGAFLNAIVAAIIGTKFPGNGVVLTKQHLIFPKPCRINTDTEICLRLIQERKITKVSYECKQMGQVVFKGEADLLLKSS